MADDSATRLAALKRARDSGVLTVRHGDTSTQFRTLAEIESIIASLESDIAAASSGTMTRTRLRYPIQLTKGL